jgi:hypothetical protein
VRGLIGVDGDQALPRQLLGDGGLAGARVAGDEEGGDPRTLPRAAL